MNLAGLKRFVLSRSIVEEIATHDRQLEGLSPRQHAVAKLVQRGLTNHQIGATLGLSHRTVEKHRQAAMDRIGARSVADLVRIVSLSSAILCDDCYLGDHGYEGL